MEELPKTDQTIHSQTFDKVTEDLRNPSRNAVRIKLDEQGTAG